MQIAGSADVGTDRHYLVVKELKNSVFYFLVSPEPVRGTGDTENAALPVVIHDAGALPAYYSTDYLIESIQRSKVTGKVSKWGSGNVIEMFLDAVSYARSYRFADMDVEEDSEEHEDGKTVRTYSAADVNVAYRRVDVNGSTSHLRVRKGQFHLDLVPMEFRTYERTLKYEDVTNEQRRNVLCATIKTITLRDLDARMDMSWYHDDSGTVLKDYRSIKSIYDFEISVVTPLVKGALAASKDSPFVVTLDTETTGLAVYDLSEDNPDRSHCVCIQLSWEEDQGVAVFTDMEHFQNIPNEYVAERLEQLFRWYEGSAEVKYWEAAPGSKSLSECSRKTAVLERGLFFLVGHNFSFDRKTMYQIDKRDIWFDADTLQMAFDINPQVVRGNNKLKALTRRVFGHETPELSDVLGRGNEDKYRFLVDETVADIYGCADVDYTRKLFFFLKKLMPNSLYLRYRQQDVAIQNVLAVSEYYGMKTLEDKVKKLAVQTWENIQILKRTAWSYVGVYVDYAQKMYVADAMWESGKISSREEYEKMRGSIMIDEDAVYEFDFKGSSLREILYRVLKYPIYAYTEGKQKLPKVDKFVISKLRKVKRSEGSTGRELSHDVLAYGVDRSEYERLKAGSAAEKKRAEAMCLISADEFNKLEYPLSLIIYKFADLNKEYTSYFKPILEGNMEGKIFKSYSMARIETRRIQNPGQTMKGSLKALIRSHSDDYYLLDFDMSQVEYRIMLSLAKFVTMVERMKHPERDYHTETASVVNNIPPHKVSKKMRKLTKPVSFGVPYGLGERSLCEQMFGRVNEDTLFSTRVLLYKWKQNNSPIMDLLEEARKDALMEWEISDELRDFINAWEMDSAGQPVVDESGRKVPVPVSRVSNIFGFYRVFNIKSVGQTQADVDRRRSGRYTAAESSIRRAAGNYPIQSFAAELFRIILMRFYWRCVREGIADKVIWHMLVHDELLCSVHKSIHPFFVFKIVKESCMITMNGHTKYFVGINIGNTWAECKDDAREAPVFFVNRMVEAWDNGSFRPENTPAEYLKNGDAEQGYWFNDPWEFIKTHRDKYVEDRIGEVIRTMIDVDNGPVDVPELLKKFDNYTVRAYVNDYPVNTPVDEDAFVIGKDERGKALIDQDALDNSIWSSRLETWALRVFGEGKDFIRDDGKRIKLKKYAAQPEEVTEDEFVDFAELFEDDRFEHERSWTFDEENVKSVYQRNLLDMTDYEEETYEVDYTKRGKASNLAEMIVKKDRYRAVRIINKQIVIPYRTEKQVEECKKKLAGYRASSGYRVVFKDVLGRLHMWIHLRDSVNLDEVDAQVAGITAEREQERGAGTEEYKFQKIIVCGGRALVPVKSRSQQERVEAYLARNKSDEGIPVVFRTPLGRILRSGYKIEENQLKEFDLFTAE